jgi:hypothetical protein
LNELGIVKKAPKRPYRFTAGFFKTKFFYIMRKPAPSLRALINAFYPPLADCTMESLILHAAIKT